MDVKKYLFNLLDIDDSQVIKDQGKLKIIRDLRKDLVILRKWCYAN